MEVQIIGAGLSGPAAALAMAREGHRVNVYEARTQSELWSAGVLGITNANVDKITDMGIYCAPCIRPGSYAVRSVATRDGVLVSPDNWTNKFNIARWGDLHELLVNAAEKNGASFHFNHVAPEMDADLVIHAQGIKYASHHSHFTYAGYVVTRGTAAISLPHNPSWVSLHDEEKRYVLNAGRTPTGYSWMLYTHRDKYVPHTITNPNHPIHSIVDSAYEVVDSIPMPYKRLILDGNYGTQISPIGDWTMPRMAWWYGQTYNQPGRFHVDLGDAIAPVRPHTTMGANLGLSEAFTLPGAFGKDLTLHALNEWEDESRRNRVRQIRHGAALGIQLMGK